MTTARIINDTESSMAVPASSHTTRNDSVESLTGGLMRNSALVKPQADCSTLRISSPASNEAIAPSIDRDRPIALSGFDAILKRTLDLVAGLTALLVFAPLLMIVAILIRLDSKGSALYRQPRTGINGRVFEVYKLRTMYTNSSTRFVQAGKNDPRITRIGALLRRTSLDELPQLLNVIEGTMSLVGPRPHPLGLDAQFRQQLPFYDSRYMVKPGITGLAQVKGYRGETRETEAMANRIRYDRLYISRWNIFLDIKLLMITAFKGWIHKNAY
ncbi:sugar transferase [Granulosicoccus sp.]|nr:sugar transferase [Granulosicoccus sp.]